MTMTIQLPDDKVRRIEAAANELGLTVEKFVEQTLDATLTRKETVRMAFDYVLQKNAELYRRLAK
jgi:hypothetical protein